MNDLKDHSYRVINRHGTMDMLQGTLRSNFLSGPIKTISTDFHVVTDSSVGHSDREIICLSQATR